MIHETWPRWCKLIKVFESMVDPSMSEMQNVLAKSALKCFQKKSNDGIITKYHKIATILNPKKRKLRKYGSENERNQIIEELKFLVRKLDLHFIPSQNNQKEKSSDDDEDELSCGDKAAIEVNNYLTSKFVSCDDVLEFWKTHVERFPNLSKIAAQILSIPSSTACVERSFSDLRNLISEKREKINADSVSATCVCRSLQKLVSNI